MSEPTAAARRRCEHTCPHCKAWTSYSSTCKHENTLTREVGGKIESAVCQDCGKDFNTLAPDLEALAEKLADRELEGGVAGAWVTISVARFRIYTRHVISRALEMRDE